MKEARLKDIEARANAATEGPWAWESVGLQSNEWALGTMFPTHEGEVIDTYDEATGKFGKKPVVVEGIAQSCGEGLFANARFIAAARSDVPALCAAVRERDATIIRMREALSILRERFVQNGTVAEAIIDHALNHKVPR